MVTEYRCIQGGTCNGCTSVCNIPVGQCGASTDSLFAFLAECTLPEDHLGPHVDRPHEVKWTVWGAVE